MLIVTILYFVNFIISAIESSLTREISIHRSIFDEPYSSFDDYCNNNILTSEDFECENCTLYATETSKLQIPEKIAILSVEQENDQSKLYSVEMPSVSIQSSVFEFLETPEKEVEYMASEKTNSENLEVVDLKDNERIEDFEDAQTNDNLIYCEIFRLKFDSINKINCNDRCDAISKKCKSEMKNAVLKFIELNISKQHMDFYIKRLESIERAHDILDNFDHHNHLNTISLSAHDIELISFLKIVRFIFKTKNKFNEIACKIFSRAFDSEFRKRMNIFKTIFDNEQILIYARYNFYFEFMKLFKYVDEIPELMSLCGIYTNRVFLSTPTVLHLINLFLEHVGNIKDDRAFILCLINKAFMYSNRRDLNFFLVQRYKVICSRKHPNLHFLFWEMSLDKRNDIRKKLKNSDILILNDVDKKHAKTIFLIYLYTHTFFLDYYNFKHEEFKTFNDFFERVVFSTSCFACHFDEYLEIIKKQIKSFK